MFIATEQGGGLRQEAKWALEALPDHLRDRVWDAIRGTGSGLISGEVIAQVSQTALRPRYDPVRPVMG